MKAPLAALLLSLIASLAPALAHGSMSRPVSRVYQIYLEDPQSPDHPSSRAAIAVAGTQAFYDWHEVNRLVPDYNYRAIIPDGQLASAGRAKYAGLDLLRSDWPKTRVHRGPYHMIFNAHVPHDPSFFQAFISRQGWNPLQPLRWSDLEPLPGAEFFRRQGNLYTFDTELPARTGHHVLYVIWQRIDPAGEAFFSISDVDFGDGSGYGNPYDGPTVLPPDSTDHGGHAHLAAHFQVQSQWSTGFSGEVTITNTTPYLWRGWSVSFGLNGDLQNVWSSRLVSRIGNRYTVTNEAWNAAIQPGQKLVFGFNASPAYSRVGAPYDFLLNGSHSLPGAGAGGSTGGGGTGGGSGTGTGTGTGGSGTPAPNPPAPAITVTQGGATLTFTEDNRWPTGFTGTVRITNRGTALIGAWTLAFALNGTVTEQWNAVRKSVSGTTQTFGNASWNGSIAPGATVSFGFNASASPGVRPSSFVFKGTPAASTGSTGSAPTTGSAVRGRLDLKATSNWGSGFTGSATVTHVSGPNLNGWTLSFDFPHRITTLWDAVLVSKVGNRYTVRNAAWNGSLKAGGKATFGFNADPGGTITPPSNVTLK